MTSSGLQALVHVAKALLLAEKCKLQEQKQKCVSNDVLQFHYPLFSLVLCFREWLRGVALVLLQSPWETRQMAAKCMSEMVESRPVFAEWLLDQLEEVVDQVSIM